ncbi:MAG: autotransporter outer membrane beta-barrel domain-containing protein [Akkermansia sp.]|nr:autotransporter outer membrane beta-barrel domain-containing protein [Akkermansia sp.]
MKLHLPKMLAVAVLAAMSVSSVFANAPQRHTPESIITDSLDSIGSAKIVAKDGDGDLNITAATTSLTSCLFVREGKVLVGGGTDKVKLSITPSTGYSTYGSLIVAGKNAEVVFDNADFINGSAAFIRIGGYDGNGTLKLLNGSTRTGSDCELFTIGVNAMPSGDVTAAPQCTTKGGTGTDASDNYVGTYAPAKNGSGVTFGRGDVIISGGSEIELGHASFWMGEGSLTVEDGGKAVAGDYRGFRALLGLGENTTSDIIVKEGSQMDVNMTDFQTSYGDKSTTNITIDGEDAVFNVTGKNLAAIGSSKSDTLTNINIKNGGDFNLAAGQILLGNERSGNVVNINVEKESTLDMDSNSTHMYEGTTITNEGAINIDTNPDQAFYMFGGEIINKADGVIKARDLYAYARNNGYDKDVTRRIVNDGTYEVIAEFYIAQSEFINNGTMKGHVMMRSGAQLTNGGTITDSVDLYGKDAVLTATDGSTQGKVFMSRGAYVVDGNVTMTGDLTEYKRADDEVDAQLVFTEDGHLDMSGNSVKLGAVTLVLQKDGHVGQMTSVDDVDFFSNYSSSDVTDETVVVVMGSDGSTSVRQLGNMNYGTFLGGSRNQRAFYNALEAMVATGDAPQWAEALSNTQDAEALEAGIDALSGHEYATAMSSQIEGNMGHLRRLRGAMGKGTALGSYVVSPGSKGAVDEKGNEVMAATPAVTDVRNWRVGVSAFHEETEIDSDARGDGYDRSETGAMLTAEYYMNKDLTLGGALSYGRTNLRTDGAKRRHEDNTRFDVYALYGKKRWSFATSLGLGLHDHELERELADTKVDGYSVNFMQDAAYTVLSCDDSNVQVFGTVESSWNEIDSFSDGMISGASQDAWSTDVTVGLRYNHALPALGNAPAGVFSAQTGVTASIGDIKSGVDMNINGYGYRQESATRNRWGWNLGAGVDVPVRTNMSVYGAVDAVMRGDSNSVDGQVGVKVSF